MTLYTPYPIEEVMKGAGDTITPLEEMTIDGLTLQVRRQSNEHAVIERLISPDPNHYLNPKYTPGQVIQLKPQI